MPCDSGQKKQITIVKFMVKTVNYRTACGGCVVGWVAVSRYILATPTSRKPENFPEMFDPIIQFPVYLFVSLEVLLMMY